MRCAGQRRQPDHACARCADNRNGEIAKGTIDAQTGSLDNRDGKVIGKTTMALRSDTADNRAGVIQADQQLTLKVDRLDNRDKGRSRQGRYRLYRYASGQQRRADQCGRSGQP